MLIDKDISIHLSCQQFECKSFEITDEKTVLMFTSNRSTGDVVCPYCGGRVHVYDSGRMVLRDMPLWHGVPLSLDVNHHGYRCTVCGRSFSEDFCMRYPGTRITYRAAKWVAGDMKGSLEAQFTLNPVRLLTDKATFPVATKDMTNIVGRNVGESVLPLKTSSDALKDAYAKAMKEAGIL